MRLDVVKYVGVDLMARALRGSGPCVTAVVLSSACVGALAAVADDDPIVMEKVGSLTAKDMYVVTSGNVHIDQEYIAGSPD